MISSKTEEPVEESNQGSLSSNKACQSCSEEFGAIIRLGDIDADGEEGDADGYGGDLNSHDEDKDDNNDDEEEEGESREEAEIRTRTTKKKMTTTMMKKKKGKVGKRQRFELARRRQR